MQQCKSLLQAKLIHQQLLVKGLTDRFSTDLISAYIVHNAPFAAKSLLERLIPSPPAVFWWNALIRRCLTLGFFHDAFSLFRRMQSLGWSADHYTFPFVLKACGEVPSLYCGASIHALFCVNGFDSNVFVCNAVVAMYSRCGALDDARQMFDEMREKGVCDIVSWNSIVSAYGRNENSREAVNMFYRMTSEFFIRPDVVSLVNVLPVCASLGAISLGKQVHCFAVRNGLFEDIFVGNALVDLYAKCGLMEEAKKIFERMKMKDVISWNTMVTGYSQTGGFDKALGLLQMMRAERIQLDVVTWSAVIAGYAQKGYGYEALDMFRQMQLSGTKANVVTLVSLLSGCASIGALLQGKEIHTYVIKCILNVYRIDRENDLLVTTALIDMYAKCKSITVARSIFDSVLLKDRTVATWTVMIGGYAQHGEADDGLELFSKMFQEDKTVKPNAFTICCVLMACARLSALRLGRQIHAHVFRCQPESASMMFVENCLIDMYSKCGDIDAARVVFNKMPKRNSVSWTSLLNGYGIHGRGEEALDVFDRMRAAGVVPDDITSLVMLYACSHSGMVDQGVRYFNKMYAEFGVVPGLEHYACMVDLLGRAGRLDEAMKLIESMPMEPAPVVWVALLSGCRLHANVELGEYAAKRLVELESENDGSYTLLSNIYASARRWKDVARVRSLMKHTGIKKRPGCSWIQGKKGTATFYVGDRTHPEWEPVYEQLSSLIESIKTMGYVPETSFALHDVDDEEKDDLLFEHSEKLALAYGILTTAPGLPIRITKNLRVCGDCHSAIAYISRIVEHEIILRDSSRFHHFKKGSCSCRGYW